MATIIAIVVGVLCLYLLYTPIRLTYRLGYGWVCNWIAIGIGIVLMLAFLPMVIATIITIAFWAAVAWIALKVFLTITQD